MSILDRGFGAEEEANSRKNALRDAALAGMSSRSGNFGAEEEANRRKQGRGTVAQSALQRIADRTAALRGNPFSAAARAYQKALDAEQERMRQGRINQAWDRLNASSINRTQTRNPLDPNNPFPQLSRPQFPGGQGPHAGPQSLLTSPTGMPVTDAGGGSYGYQPAMPGVNSSAPFGGQPINTTDPLNTLLPADKRGGELGDPMMSGDRSFGPGEDAWERAKDPTTAAADARNIDKGASVKNKRDMTGTYGVRQQLRPLEDRILHEKDPAIKSYYQHLASYEKYNLEGQAGLIPTNVAPGTDGDFGLAGASQGNTNASTQWNVPAQYQDVFTYVLVKDPSTGKMREVNLAGYYQKTSQEAMKDPAKAGPLIWALTALGAYGGGSDKYAGDRVQQVKGKDGQPQLVGHWTIDDANALHAYLPQLVGLQIQQAESGQAPKDIETIIADQALARTQEVKTLGTGGSDGSGGGGYRHYGGGGGGGGGGTGAVRYTDSEQLKSFVDSIARARMGRVLTTEESAGFVAFYHGLEDQMAAQYYAGKSNTQLDPESQAVGWIESRFRNEAAKQQSATYYEALQGLIQTGSLGGGSGSGGINSQL